MLIVLFADTNTSRVTSDVETSSFSQELIDSDIITSLSVGSPVMESTKGIKRYVSVVSAYK